MAFLKHANAVVAKPVVSLDAWRDLHAKSLPFDKREATTKLLLQKFDPQQYLLSHCTIIASVDVENGPGSLGTLMDDGFQIDRRFQDYYITPGTSKYVNSNCFVPGTFILMGDGTEKPIEEVKVGDSVITHTGVVRKVTEVFKKHFKGSLRRIKRLGDTRSLEVTAEHPFWAMVPARVCGCGCGEALNRRHRKAAVHRFQDLIKGHQFNDRKFPKPEHTWVSAGLLEKGDFLAYPRLQGEQLEAGITPGKAKLIGYFLAEGYYYKQTPNRLSLAIREELGLALHGPSVPVAVEFSLNSDEQDTLAKAIRDLLLQEFGVASFSHKVSANGINVQSHQSLELVRFFQTYCGEGSHNKRLDPRVLTWPLDLQKLLVQTYFEGDGCVEATAGGWLAATTASMQLASQLHVILSRLGVYTTRTVTRRFGRKRVREANGSVSIVNDHTKTSVSYVLQVGAVHAESLVSGSFLEEVYNKAQARRRKKSLSYRITPKAAIFPIRSSEKVPYEGFLYNFETDQDHSYVANGVSVHNCDAWERQLLLTTYKTFIGGSNFVEHIQLPELNKGRIIDAVARDIGDSIYVDILVATERKYQSLVESIQSSQVNTLSMGCSVSHTTCSQCGNVAEDETQLCKHVKYSKGNTFLDALGKARKIAELCGHASDPKSVKFIEASWVSNPAFKGAVVRNILSPEELTQYAPQLGKVFSFPAPVADPSLMARAANTQVRHLGPAKTRTLIGEGQSFDFGQGGQFEGADEASKPAKAPPQDDPLEKAVTDLASIIREKALEKVRNEVTQKELSPRADLKEDSNNNLIREAALNPQWQTLSRAVTAKISDPNRAKRILLGLLLFKSGGWNAVRAANCFSGPEVLGISRFLDEFEGVKIAGEVRVYRTILAVGGHAPYVDNSSFLAACRRVFGRDLTSSECDALITKGRLYDLGSL